jgi:hypothetical protein
MTYLLPAWLVLHAAAVCCPRSDLGHGFGRRRSTNACQLMTPPENENPTRIFARWRGMLVRIVVVYMAVLRLTTRIKELA